MNEAAIGQGIQQGGVAREQLFVTSKLWVQDTGYERTRDAIAQSLRRLRLDYLDLFLIHQPFGDMHDSWHTIGVLAKTVRRERMAENLAIDHFDLDEADMAAIATLETGTSSFFFHRDPAIVQWMAGRKLEI
ncbi:aldo/keto reductase [Janthinobacterium sp. UMAB-60]|uniref:aldo/keto reductase n=1 Tax=Janthinobacterium sp. UMAB-60 TaxID=1365365 RepID=UPI0035AC20A4